ncbi:uncharacterized protein LOC120104476 [Phoenix dactylifera]|uniref:Uncharacterized protein LOC120104476 n=1 Tax=Phoenix dactylifera TaxID=42345 RepID=A0A8B8ZE77_PHODC|nr:uncharacterized protein LOC120104476 [Phoenix dactylifera]
MTLYKATAKILAVRLRDILPRLISPEQRAFVGGRSITDNVLIAQEFMFDLRRAPMRRSLMGIKLDMERAYGRMRWDLVQQSLQGFGWRSREMDQLGHGMCAGCFFRHFGEWNVILFL